MDTLEIQRRYLRHALLRAVLILVVVVGTALALAGCGGGDWECPEPTPVADGKKAIPTEPCGDDAF